MRAGRFFLIIGVVLICTRTIVQGKEGARIVPQAAENTISLDLKGVNLVDLFRVLSLKTGVTIVPSKDITGRVTIFLNNVVLSDVLDIVTVSQGLALEKRGNIYYVMTGNEYRAFYGKQFTENRQVRTFKFTYAQPESVLSVVNELRSDIGKVVIDKATRTVIVIDIPEKIAVIAQAIKDLDVRLVTEVFDLNYADPAQAKTALAGAVTAGVGEVVADERSRKLIVTDIPSAMEKIRIMVRAIDTESRQVYIDAQIVQVALNDQYHQGIEWQKVFNGLDHLQFVGNFPIASALAAYQKINVGVLDSDKYTATIQFLEMFGTTKILSRPQIAVVNNQEARVMVGSREAYVTQTLSQAQTTTVTSESIQFVDVGVKLYVMPVINTEGFITLKIKPEVSSVKDTLKTSGGSVIPIVETSEAETTVKVKDGTMIMMGGLLKERRTNAAAGVPVLSRIPLLGGMFKNKSTVVENTELVIFITPHLTRGDVPVRRADIETYVPPEITPDDIQKKIVLDELETITGGIEDTAAAGENSEDLSKPQENSRFKGFQE